MIQSRQIIHPGDEIESLEFNGLVKEINSRSVVVDTSDGRVVHLPNAEVLANPLVNDTSMGRADRRSRSGWNPAMWSERRSVSSVRLRHHRA